MCVDIEAGHCSGMYRGKKLLVLGSSTGATDIVLHAQSEGARVYVADNLPLEKSAAKAIADVPVYTSTANVQELCALVVREKIDGVVAGISGFNLISAMKVSEQCGLRYHFNQDQWDSVETKDGFRALCEKFEVPCPRTYYIGNALQDLPWTEFKYPLVLKPVDSGASQGVYVCKTRDELEKMIPRSREYSAIGRIIIEEFCTGEEFTAHYVIRNGVAHLVCLDNRYPVALHQGEVTTIPVARIYPSLFLGDYKEEVNSSLCSLFSSLELSCAVTFVQGLYNRESNEFCIFEAGMRSAAELPNRFLSKVTTNDYMHMLVDYVLLGDTYYDLSKDDPGLGDRCCGIVSFVARGGVVGAIRGLEETVAATPSVLAYESRYPVGSTTPDGDTLHQIMLRFVMNCESREQMSQDIDYLNRNIEVLDSFGNSMVLKFNPARLWDIV